MRIVPFIYNILDKFAPMDEVEKANLRTEAGQWYADQLEKIKADEKAVKGASIYKKLETWQWRTGLSILFIIIVPMIQSYLAGDDDYEEED